jgi:hypothetical protein
LAEDRKEFSVFVDEMGAMLIPIRNTLIQKAEQEVILIIPCYHDTCILVSASTSSPPTASCKSDSFRGFPLRLGLRH